MIFRKSAEHLNDNNMGYWEHMVFAAGHGFRCIKAGVLLFIHSLIPALFPKTGSILVQKLNKSFVDHKDWINLKIRTEIFKEDS